MLKFAAWMNISLLLLTLIFIPACSDTAEDPSTATTRGRTVIQEARETHGSNILDQAVVEFDFRGDHFTVHHDRGTFSYERTYVDSSGRRIREALTNDSLYRTIDGIRQNLSSNEQLSIETTVNSVVYFSLLPHALNDSAVQPRYLGRTSIQDEPYHEVEVTFRKEGGGRDWEDRFVYWIHRDRHTIDYLAYYYHTNEGGSRYRKAVNPRRIGGVRFADYLNYTAAVETLGTSVEHYDSLFEDDRLEKVSEVRLENIQVRPLE